MNLFLARRSRPFGLALASSVAGALLLVWVAACGDGPAGPAPQPPPAQPPPPPPPNRAPVATAAIPSDTLSAGDSLLVDLSAHFRDPDGDALTFAAATSDAAVATVSVSGDTAMVAAIAAGTATVTATATDPGALRAAQSFAVTVEAEVERVVVTPDSATLTAIGDTVRLTADAFDEAGRAVTGAAIAWSSGDAAVAVVDTAGLVTANGPGRTTIFASAAGPAGDVVGEAIVSVTPSAHSVTVSPSDAALAVGDTLRLRATVTDRNGHDVEGAEVTWTSNSPAVAEVRATGTPGVGLVSAISDGSATITATAGEARGTARITVSGSPDRRVLAALYAATGGPNWKRRANWLTDAPLDEWQGLEVDAEGRVTQLILYENNLRGPIPPALAELTQLTKLDLSRNTLTGPIPPELGSLVHVEHLDISRNRQLTGSIPPELGLLTNLKYLRLGSNRLTGEIPPELGSLPRLVELRFNFNGLTGTIPPELGSLASLENLAVAYNGFSGPVPPELGDLTRLRSLALGYNNFTGVIPREVTELRRLVGLSFGGNDGLCAPGTPAFATWLRSVETVEGPFCNAADRAALASLYEATDGPDWTNAGGWLGDAAVDEWWGVTADSLGRVVELDLADNNLSGRVHPALAALHRVTALRIGGNPLTGPLPLSLARLPLRELDYSDTEVCAPADASFRDWLNNIPSHRGTGVACDGLSDREILVSFYHATGGPGWTRSDNWLTDAPLGEWHGIGVDDEGRVTELALAYNNLTGSIPPEVGALERLRALFLSGGNLTGPIPPELGDLAELHLLHVIKNDLEGRIPPELGRLSRLEILGLSENRLEGGIPPELGALERMRSLYLDENDLTGPIPPELGKMARLLRLYLWDNRLEGPIPSSLGGLAELEELRLQENDLSGSIPPELGGLGALEQLMLFENDLSGPLPPELGNLRALTHLGVFGNAGLAGPLPANLTRLRRLREFYAGGTDLCVPTDAEFRLWLRKIPASRVASCEGEAMAYLVQAAQSPEFPVPLVAGRDALLRVFVTAARSAEAEMPPVHATFYVDGGEVYAANIPGRGQPIPTEIDESSLSMSANARIPGHVLQPGLEMVIEVDPGGTLDPSLGVRRRIPETGRLAPEVRTLPVLDLTLIPFLWTQDPDSTTIDDVRAMAADPRRVLWPVGTLLPVGELAVTAHEPVWSSTNYGALAAGGDRGDPGVGRGDGLLHGDAGGGAHRSPGDRGVARPVELVRHRTPDHGSRAGPQPGSGTRAVRGCRRSRSRLPRAGWVHRRVGVRLPGRGARRPRLHAGHHVLLRPLLDQRLPLHERAALPLGGGGGVGGVGGRAAGPRPGPHPGEGAVRVGRRGGGWPAVPGAGVRRRCPTRGARRGRRLPAGGRGRGGAAPVLAEFRHAGDGRRRREFGVCARASGGARMGGCAGPHHAHRPRRIDDAGRRDRPADRDPARSGQRAGARDPPRPAGVRARAGVGNRGRGGDASRHRWLERALQPRSPGPGGVAPIGGGRSRGNVCGPSWGHERLH